MRLVGASGVGLASTIWFQLVKIWGTIFGFFFGISLVFSDTASDTVLIVWDKYGLKPAKGQPQRGSGQK